MPSAQGIPKSPTGIAGFDDLTLGGVPTGRPTLVCGSAGCGKTLFATTFLIHGARDYDEPGVFVTFEERPGDIVSNVASLGFAVDELVEDQKIAFEYIALERSELEEAGDYDLEGLFLRLEAAIDSIGAKRVVLDTIESLFSVFSNEAILRAEIRRLFDWLKDRGMTTVITAERGDGTLTRQGLEEYVSDCVILLDHRVQSQISTRRLRIVKYRGTAHGTNEYPFLLDEDGFSVLPVSSLGLDHKAYEDGFLRNRRPRRHGGRRRLASRVQRSDLGRRRRRQVGGGRELRRGGLRRRRARAVFFLRGVADESVRNMKSLGIDIGRWIASDRLRYVASRPTFYSLEMHLAVILRDVTRFDPDLVVLDPISSFLESGDRMEVQSMLLRVIDFLKGRGVTAVFTHLMHGQEGQVETEAGLSSLMDAWILLLNREVNGEFNRELYLLKARGTSHSNQVREFTMSEAGIKLGPAVSGARAARSPARPGRNGGGQSPAGRGCGAKPRCRVPGSRSSTSGGAPRLRWKRCRQSSTPMIALTAILQEEGDYLRQAADDRVEMEKSRKS